MSPTFILSAMIGAFVYGEDIVKGVQNYCFQEAGKWEGESVMVEVAFPSVIATSYLDHGVTFTAPQRNDFEKWGILFCTFRPLLILR